MNKRLTSLAAVAAMSLPSAANAAELVTNGGFESALNNWTEFGSTTNDVTAAGVEGVLTAYSKGAGPGGFFQTLATVPGELYSVSFLLQSLNSPSFKPVSEFTVDFAGYSASFSNLAAPNAFLVSFKTLATSSTTDIKFTFSNAIASNVIFVDAVSVQGLAGAVPEPATWAMMLIGFGAVGAAMRHRRRQQVRTTVAYA